MIRVHIWGILFALASAPLCAQKTLPAYTPEPDPPSICDAISGNLVTNCGFETGNFSGWTTGNLEATFVDANGNDYPSNSGNYFALLGNVNGQGSLSQTIATLVGDTYQVQFYVTGDGSPSFFSASFGGQTLTTLNSPNQPWTLYSFDITASSTSSVLDFQEQDPAYYYGLDDVSVVNTTVAATPEPVSLLLLGTVLSIIALQFRKRASRKQA